MHDAMLRQGDSNTGTHTHAISTYQIYSQGFDWLGTIVANICPMCPAVEMNLKSFDRKVNFLPHSHTCA